MKTQTPFYSIVLLALLGPFLQASPDQELLINFIRFLLTSAGTGAAVYGTIEELKRLWPQRWPELTGDQKFYLAYALSFIYPIIAYAAQLAILGLPWTWEGVFATIVAGHMASQRLHRNQIKAEKRALAEENAAMQRATTATQTPTTEPIDTRGV